MNEHKHLRSQLRFSWISTTSAEFTVPSNFSTDESTEDNHGTHNREFYGSYESIRKTLDYSNFGVCSKFKIYYAITAISC